MISENKAFRIRAARAEDCENLFAMIMEFADYTGNSGIVTTTLDKLRESFFEKKQAEALIAFDGETPAAYAVFYQGYSTWMAQATLFLEDLYIREQYRRGGLGGQLFSRLAGVCVERGYGRMEWCCRDWNTKAIAFYTKNGGERYEATGVYHLEAPRIRSLAEKSAALF